MGRTRNSVSLRGFLGLTPELRHTQSGASVVNLSVATDEGYTNAQGERVDRTEWHRVVVWGQQAENVAEYLRKGSFVAVEGSLQTRSWEDEDGETHYTTEIKAYRVDFLDSKPESSTEPAAVAEEEFESDDESPF